MKTATVYRTYRPVRSAACYHTAAKKMLHKILDGLLVVVSGLGIVTLIGFILLI